MDSEDLSDEQAQRMLDALTPAKQYLSKLLSRMQQRSFDQEDDLWKRSGEVCRLRGCDLNRSGTV